jgi:ribonuclease BN (tRNA processing enzyme)
LIDFGPGVVRRAAAAQRKWIAALNPINIRHAFVTHLHSDNTVGYPDLILTPWVIGRTDPLEVYGPRRIKAMTEHVLAAWAGASRSAADLSSGRLAAATGIA